MAADRYGAVAKTFHWGMFVLLVAAFTLGLTIGAMSNRERLADIDGTKLIFDVHKTIGLTIFVFAFIRLAWRHVRPPPPLPASLPAWERGAARISHVLMYGLMFAIPITGWLMHAASPFDRPLFGIISLPDPFKTDPELERTLKGVHFWLGMTLLAAVAVHVAAALKHHFIDRDDVLRRMLPFARPKEGRAP